MAKQVIPFKVPVCLGYMGCQGDDFREPEGTVFFDSPPKIGDKAILSDNKEWDSSKRIK